MSPLSLNAVDLRRKLDAMPSHGPLHLLLETCARWSDDAARFAAAIAFHTVLALAGVTVLAYALAGAALTGDPGVAWLAWAQGHLGGPDSHRLQSFIHTASRHPLGLSAVVLAWVTTLVGVAGGFAQWRQAFASVAGSAPLPSLRAHEGRKRAAGLALVVVLALSVSASVMIGAALTSLGEHAALRHLGAAQAFAMVHLTLVFSMLAVVLAALFRWLPDTAPDWQAAWMAGALGAFTLGLGTCLAGRYLVHADLSSVRGLVQAGVVGMLGVYGAAQVLLFAAALAVVLHEGEISPGSTVAAPKPVALPTQNLARRTAAPASITAVRARRTLAANGPHGRRSGPSASPGKSAVILKFPSGKRI